mmetsp:Transcript_99336/g.179326  ORF Transcript_99336/g.179326 Transcript_99336/m.179326 type:complete len:87 (-) Transcript_99336:41-301(-)
MRIGLQLEGQDNAEIRINESLMVEKLADWDSAFPRLCLLGRLGKAPGMDGHLEERHNGSMLETFTTPSALALSRDQPPRICGHCLF